MSELITVNHTRHAQYTQLINISASI